MSDRIIIDPKRQGDTVNLPFDFTSKLAAGETISTKVVTATVLSGVDPTPSAIVNGAATSSGSIVTQSITAGVLGVFYLLVCKITTSLSQTLSLGGVLLVEPDGP